MAQKSKSRTHKKSSYRGFEGVDLKKTHTGDESVSLIENFHITEDGSLKKRSGFKSVYVSSNKSAAFKASHRFEYNGTETHYFTDGFMVKEYTPSSGAMIDIGEVETQSGAHFFFDFDGYTYLFDNSRLFMIDSYSISEVEPYIPLYGKDWPSGVAGKVLEAPNLFTTKIAISYKLTEPATSYLPLGELKVRSVNSLYRNGELLTKSDYSLDTTFNHIVVPSFAAGDEFFAIVTLRTYDEYSEQKTALFNSHAVSDFYELDKSNLFFWGNEVGNKIFYSSTVDRKNAEFISEYVGCSKIYVPVNSYFCAGPESETIKAFIRHYDRVLIMNKHSTWITNLKDLESRNLTLKSINASVGCAVFDACARIGNTIISAGKDGAYEWTSDTDELSECTARCISEPIKDLLPKKFFINSKFYYNEPRGEVWFYSSQSKETWIYNIKHKAWSRFKGFSPSAFFKNASEAIFFEGKNLYVFKPSLTCDVVNGENREIVASFKSGELEFNSRDKKKLSTATVRGSFSGGSLNATFIFDGKTSLSADITPSNVHSVIPFRTRSGSFRSLTFELTASGEGTQIIHGIELDAD
ncbi:MAG: hypothetical protein J6U68_04270 [Clostridia bacterium]|nr:hypothetical protein [Clostridia bacterium]